MAMKFTMLVLYLMLHCVMGTHELTLTLLTEESQATGAMCLDGSPPGYYMHAGSGDGANKWVVYLMGGAWCQNVTDCYARSFSLLGSTRMWSQTIELYGIFSGDQTVNPDFYNWNRVFIIYCDGGIFAGDREDPVLFQGRNLTFRGYRNLQTAISHLNQERGMSNATDIILAGCSAGGLATMLHADYVQTLISDTANFKAFNDAGYIIDIPTITGIPIFNFTLTQVIATHDVDEAITPACRMNNTEQLWRCLSAPYMYQYIQAPIYVLNSQYDSFILENVYFLPCIPPDCSVEATSGLQRYKAEFDRQVQPVLSSPQQNGYFFDSCYIHCHTLENDQAWSEFAINGVTIAQSFGDWYFERSTNTRIKDCDDDFPCNPTCPIESPTEESTTEVSGATRNSAASLVSLVLSSFVWMWN